MMRRGSASLAIFSAVLSVSSSLALANPYATGVTESAGVVSFTLNEAADQVTILRDGVPQNLGPKAAGTVTFNRNSAVKYQIQVTKAGGIGFATQVAPNVGGILPMFQDSVSTRFFSPRGVAANYNTSDLSLFGRVYVSNSAGGTADLSGTLPARTTGDGIYALKSNMADALGQGDNALTAGLDADFSGGGSSSPWRLFVGPDNNLYISDWADTTGTVYRTTPAVTNGVNTLDGQGGTDVSTAPNHGSINAAVVTGTQAAGNLKMYTIDEDFGGAGNFQSLWRYDIGSTPAPFTGQPTQLANLMFGSVNSVYCSLAINPANGNLYLMENRSDGNEAGVFIVRDDGTTGTLLWDSLTATTDAGLDADPNLAGTQDVLRHARGVAVSPDGKYMAIVTNESAAIVVPIVNGLPDITQRVLVQGFDIANYGRDLAFDAADNLYVVSSAWQAMRVFSPGGISITTLGSDGTFSVQSAGLAEWNVNSGGNANDASKWLMNIVPNSSGAAAKFGSKITSNATISVPSATTYGDILFDNAAASYTLAGPGTITLNAPVATPAIIVTSGNHTISAPVALAKDSAVTVASGSTLTLSGGVTGNFGLHSNGAGTTAVSGLNIATLTIDGDGTVKLSGANKITSLNIPVGTSNYLGTLDLASGRLVIDYDPGVGTPSGDIATLLDNARNGGAWDQPGITSSTVKADTAHKTVVWVEASDFFGISGAQTASWNGQGVDASSILLRATYFGDANLDGKLNGDDYALIDRAFKKGGLVGWKNGDFDGNGVVNSNDYLLLDTNYYLNKNNPLTPEFLALRAAEFGPAYVAALTAAVPEPTCLGLLAGATLGLLARRRRA